MVGVILQDSKKCEVAKGSLWKEKKVFKTKNSLKAGIKQLSQDTCILQSASSIWPTVEADKLADNDEIIITMTIAMKTFVLFANRESFIDIL